MPKTFANYSRFEQGLNFRSDDEDIDQASVAEAKGWDINVPGEISTIGKTSLSTSHKYTLDYSGGDGIDGKSGGSSFVLGRSDFDFASGSYPVSAAEASGGNTLGFYNSVRYVGILSDLEGFSGGYATAVKRHPLGSGRSIDMGADGFPVCFWHEGELRVSDRTHNAGTTLKWLGVLNRTRFSATDAWNTLSSKWVTENLNLLAPKLPAQSGNGNGVVYFDETTSTGKLPNTAADMPNLICTQTTNAEDGTWESTEYEFGMTYVYKGNQESSVTPMSMKKKNTDTNAYDAVDSYKVETRQYFSGVSLSIKNADGTDFANRMTGCRIYVKKAGGGKRWRLFLDVDFVKGARRNTFDRYETGWSRNTAGVYYTTTQIMLKNPSVETYEALTGVLNDETSVGFASKESNLNSNSWGIAKAVQRRIFYARCKYFTEDDTSVKKLYDRIFYSVGGKPDVVPTTNWIDLGINDGDEFITMETYAGRLVLFKRNKIYILNVANPNPMGWGVELQIDNNGVPNPANVQLTRYGIAWANNFGCFLYSGQQPTELSQRIGGVEWRSWLNNEYEAMPIGMHDKTNQLFITESGGTSDSTAANAWVYNFATQGWSRREDEFQAKNNGFWNDQSGNLIFVRNKTSADIHYGTIVNVTPMTEDDGISTKELILREDNFGSPGITKRFYNVKVEVMNQANAKLKVSIKTGGTWTSLGEKTLSANTDYVTKIYNIDPVKEDDKCQIKIESTHTGGVTIGNVILEYRPKRLRVSEEGN
tara:strand:+ start:16417 stop:18699 length:2283 start_codon:yes stop_codon:yes gene_type:complete